MALLATVRAFEAMQLDPSGITAVSMPCFGTTNRTRLNARSLAIELGCTFREIDISASVTQHFHDIGQDPNQHDVTYENAQARERTLGIDGYCQSTWRHCNRYRRFIRICTWLGNV